MPPVMEEDGKFNFIWSSWQTSLNSFYNPSRLATMQCSRNWVKLPQTTYRTDIFLCAIRVIFFSSIVDRVNNIIIKFLLVDQSLHLFKSWRNQLISALTIVSVRELWINSPTNKTQSIKVEETKMHARSWACLHQSLELQLVLSFCLKCRTQFVFKSKTLPQPPLPMPASLQRRMPPSERFIF